MNKQFYCCPHCKLTLSRDEVREAEEQVTSEFWGVRATQMQTYLVCSSCGDDVEETDAPEEESIDD